MHPGGEAGASETATAGERGTPSSLRWQYQTLGYVPSTMQRSVLTVEGYVDQYPSPEDLRLFMNEYRTDGDSSTFTVI